MGESLYIFKFRSKPQYIICYNPYFSFWKPETSMAVLFMSFGKFFKKLGTCIAKNVPSFVLFSPSFFPWGAGGRIYIDCDYVYEFQWLPCGNLHCPAFQCLGITYCVLFELRYVQPLLIFQVGQKSGREYDTTASCNWALPKKTDLKL